MHEGQPRAGGNGARTGIEDAEIGRRRFILKKDYLAHGGHSVEGEVQLNVMADCVTG
jgi:hypothetical protein